MLSLSYEMLIDMEETSTDIQVSAYLGSFSVSDTHELLLSLIREGWFNRLRTHYELPVP